MSLLKLLIADDEESIRIGLKHIVDWEKLGFTVVKESANGSEALRDIKDYQPDLVLLDIKMPGLTGIDVIKESNLYFDSMGVNKPSFLILSGFSQFEFAQNALNLGAKGYILKPVDEDELSAQVEKISREIHERSDNENNSKTVRKLEEKEFYHNLLKKGTFDGNTISDSEFICVVISPEVFPENDKSLITTCFEQYFTFLTGIYLFHEGNYVFIAKNPREETLINCISRMTKRYPGSVYVSVSDKFTGYDGVLKAYKQAKENGKYMYYIENCDYVTSNAHERFENCREFSDCDYNKMIERVIFYIETYDKDALYNLILELKSYLCNPSLKPGDSKEKMISFILELKHVLENKYPERDFEEVLLTEFISSVLEKKCFAETFEIMKTILFNLLEQFNTNTSDSVIVKVISYVKNNYSSDLKLEVLGDMFNCNSAYLGKKFRKHTGMQFNSYLDNLRIEDAKNKLLNTDLKIYQISKLIGYANTDYFFMKFKKACGVTPKEFRRQFGNGQNDE